MAAGSKSDRQRDTVKAGRGGHHPVRHTPRTRDLHPSPTRVPGNRRERVLLMLDKFGPGYPLSGGAGQKRGHDIGCVAVERASAPVVAHGGARVGVAGGLLHVSQRHAGVQSTGDEGVAQTMRRDALGDPGPPGQTLRRCGRLRNGPSGGRRPPEILDR
jgi:hypothetical protein